MTAARIVLAVYFVTWPLLWLLWVEFQRWYGRRLEFERQLDDDKKGRSDESR